MKKSVAYVLALCLLLLNISIFYDLVLADGGAWTRCCKARVAGTPGGPYYCTNPPEGECTDPYYCSGTHPHARYGSCYDNVDAYCCKDSTELECGSGPVIDCGGGDGDGDGDGDGGGDKKD